MIPIHFIPLAVGSLGHLVLDTEKILFEIQQIRKSQFFLAIFIYAENPVNEYFVSKLRTLFPVKKGIIWFFLHRLMRRISPSYRRRDAMINAKTHAPLSQIHESPPLFSTVNLNSLYLRSFQKHIDRLGFTKFVCLVIRDEGFDRHLNRESDEIDIQRLRHTNPQEFIPAINLLISNGFFVLRMGRHLSIQLDLETPAYSEFASEYLHTDDSFDFELFERCEFVISTGSGPDNLGLFFRKPVLYVNTIPIASVPQTRLTPMVLLPSIIENTSGKVISKTDLLKEPLFSYGPQKFLENDFGVQPKNSLQIYNFIEHYINLSLHEELKIHTTRYYE